MTVRAHRATTWPLLRKDLTEMAAQGRGYWLRGLLLVVMYGAFAFLFIVTGVYARAFPSMCGKLNFELLNVSAACLLTASSCAAAATAIAGEKERNAFALLLMTDLTPGEMLLQKLFARLVPQVGLLFCLLPLYAVCYSQGGIEVGDMTRSTALLILCLLQGASVGLFCSCRFATPSGATVAAWTAYGVFFLVATALHKAGLDRDYAFGMLGPYHLRGGYESWVAAGMRYGPGFYERAAMIASFTLLAFLCARYSLLRHAFPAPGRRRIRLVRWLHARLDWVRGRRRGASMLPEGDGVVWRERHRLGMPNFRFSMRLLVGAALVSASVCMFVTAIELDGVETAAPVIWVLALGAATCIGVMAVHADRRRGTADCMTTLPGGMVRVIRARGDVCTRLALLLTPALLAMSAVECWMNFYLEAWQWILILVARLAAWLTLSFLLLWLGMLIGSMFNSAARALPVALVLFALWRLADTLFSLNTYRTPGLWQIPPDEHLVREYLFSPFSLLHGCDDDPARDLIMAILLLIMIYGSVARVLRAWTLRRIQRTYG